MSDTTEVAIIEFLRARLDEQETAARRATGTDPGTWVAHVDWATRSTVEVLGQFARPQRSPVPPEVLKGDWYQVAVWGEIYSSRFDWRPEDDLPIAEHIAVNDPERVLADITAKRAIIEWAEHSLKWYGTGDMMSPVYLLASVYALHPDYRDEWAV